MEQGWVKFYREWLDNPIITKDTEYLAVWLYLLTNATHTEKEAFFNSKKICLMEGQLLINHKEIYEKFKIEPCKLRRIFNLLKNNYLIDYQTDKHKTLITVTRWDFYQGKNDYQNDYPMTIKRLSKQDRENEKEKRSKREKVKEKEINKNDKNEINNNPLYPPRDEEAHIHSIKDNLFDLFWQSYPKKIGKGYAKKCFDKIKPSKELVDTMIEAINVQRKSEMWQRDKGQYIPNPSTWLNQQRWLDDLKIDLTDPIEDEIWNRIEMRF